MNLLRAVARGENGDAWLYSGDGLVGTIFYVEPDAPNWAIAGKWAWFADSAISPRYLPFKLQGARRSRAAALRAAEHAWSRWLEHMGLAPSRPDTGDSQP